MRQACFSELRTVLDKHGCVIVPRLSQLIPVGVDGGAAMISASWDLKVVEQP